MGASQNQCIDFLVVKGANVSATIFFATDEWYSLLSTTETNFGQARLVTVNSGTFSFSAFS